MRWLWRAGEDWAGATEANDAVRWRASRLRSAGFDDDLARELAHDDRFDLGALLELVDRGCPTELAARILAPLE